MNLTKLIPIALLVTFASACIGDEPVTDWNLRENNQTNNTQTNNTTNPAVKLDGMFLSGHLGSYGSCPDEGFSNAGALLAEEPGADFAPCEEDDENCGTSINNCEGAQLTIKLENRGTAAAEGLSITKLALFNDDGAHVVDLPLMEVVNAETNAAAPETLAAGESVILRVTFQGPANPSELLKTGDRAYRNSGSVEITVESTNHRPVLIESGTIYTIPEIAT